ncbi:MAG: nuclear transport factor 2 family protein [Pseudomonadota bacterium]|nr:nuclear transport factor 2 family protein [Pseudomonadota bacterium]
MRIAAEANAALIERFYSAFARRDVETMLSCYRHDVVFHDPVFGTLSGPRVRAMWRMLNARAVDLAIEFGDVAATERDGSAHWEARYAFTATGRPVHNRIDASFEFRDGSIAHHVDRFSLWRWAAMALGMKGALSGWLPPVRAAIRARAAAGLTAYMAANP